ncbi:MAG: hypothetical protein K8W52_10245 [Deltaproteobacteria bacterium]|nr:hypothetical protein [Deltaproteobacteria bacterium]
MALHAALLARFPPPRVASDEMMYRRWWMGVVTGLWACSLSSQLGGHSVSTSGAGPTSSEDPGVFTVPDLFAMSRADAVAALQRAGHRGTVEDDTHNSCGSAVDGTVIELGHVCRQQPAAGGRMTASLPMTLLVQSEDPRQGRLGETMEWHLMPDVVGMPADRALAALRQAGFTGPEADNFREVADSDCQPGIVCRQFPAPLTRALLRSGHSFTMGALPKPEAPPAQAGVDAGVPTPSDAGTADPGSLF